MDEASFLRAIDDARGDEGPVRAYADWLMAQGDPRGEYLRLELLRLKTESRLAQLEREMQHMLLFQTLDAAWLDRVFPLQIVSPMVGTFYARPAPDAPPYVSVGDVCRPETTVAIIEAMKVFNEIPAGISGIITENLVADGDAVDFGRPMFRVARPPRLLSGG